MPTGAHDVWGESHHTQRRLQPATRTKELGGYGYDVVVLCYCLNDIADVSPELTQPMAYSLNRMRDKGLLARSSDLADYLRYAWIASTDPEISSDRASACWNDCVTIVEATTDHSWAPTRRGAAHSIFSLVMSVLSFER